MKFTITEKALELIRRVEAGEVKSPYVFPKPERVRRSRRITIKDQAEKFRSVFLDLLSQGKNYADIAKVIGRSNDMAYAYAKILGLRVRVYCKNPYPKKAARDSAILAMSREGVSNTDVGKEFGIGRHRVGVILKAMRELENKTQ